MVSFLNSLLIFYPLYKDSLYLIDMPWSLYKKETTANKSIAVFINFHYEFLMNYL